jgi:hypothetical protein
MKKHLGLIENQKKFDKTQKMVYNDLMVTERNDIETPDVLLATPKVARRTDWLMVLVWVIGILATVGLIHQLWEKQ